MAAPDNTQITYGSSNIGGNAKVQLGNTQVSNVFHVATAYFAPQEDVRAHQRRIAPASRKRRRNPLEHGCTHIYSKRLRLDERDCVSYNGDIVHPLFGTTQSEVANQWVETMEAYAPREENVSRPGDRASGRELASSLQQDRGEPSDSFPATIRYLNGIFRNPFLPWLKSSTTVPNTTTRFNQQARYELGRPKENSYGEVSPLKDLAAALLTFASLVACDSAADNTVLSKYRPNRKISALFAMAFYALARYVFIPQLQNSLSDLTGDCIMIEDACAERWRVPISHCEDFGMLKAYLEYRHRDRPGVEFVRLGQFNLMLGSRRGLVIRKDDWTSKRLVKPGSTMVMSVYINTDEARCTGCAGALVVNAMGEFHCTECNTFFRDLDTLKYLSQTRSSLIDSATDEASYDIHQSLYGGSEDQDPTKFQEDETWELDDSDVWGLKYIDFQIVTTQNFEDTLDASEDPQLPPASKPQRSHKYSHEPASADRDVGLNAERQDEETPQPHQFANTQRELVMIRRQQSQIERMLSQLRTEHGALTEHIPPLQLHNMRHELSISAIRTFLASISSS